MYIGLGVPHPYLGIEPLTGSEEVWYINGFASTEELAQVTGAYSNFRSSQDGMRCVVTGAKTPEADAKLSAVGPDAKIFAVRAEFSLPAAEMGSSDPSFWDSKARKK